PVRFGTAGGDSYLIDVTKFFVVAPCHDCAEVSSIGFNPNGHLDVDITIRHPFASPVAPTTRKDLHVFDVMGLLVYESLPADTTHFPSANLDLGTGTGLANADGYTALLDGAIEPWIATPVIDAHPYKVFNGTGDAGSYDPISASGFPDLVNPSGHNVFPMGGSATATYELAIATGASRKLGLVLTANYGQSAANRSQRTTPQYYLPEFNNKAAWRVTATVANNTLEAGNTGSTAELTVAVRDWQEGATVATGWSFGATAKDEVREASDIASVDVELPGVLATPQTQPGSAGVGGGSLEDKIFAFLMANTASGGAGDYQGLVTVTETLTDSRTQGFDRTLTPVNLGLFKTYQSFAVTVLDNNDPPMLTCPITSNPSPPIATVPCDLNVAAASDPDGPAPLNYEWDTNYGGIPGSFSADFTTGVPTLNFTFPTTAPVEIAVRAVDGDGAQSSICSAIFTPGPADGPQFQLPNTNNFTEQYLRHYTTNPISGWPDQGWNNSVAISPVSNDIYVLVDGKVSGDTRGGQYVVRSSDGGVTWGTPVMSAPYTNPPPAPPNPGTNFDQWTVLPYVATIGCTADGHPVVAFQEGICWTRFAFGTPSGANSTTWAVPQTVFVEGWGSYYEWFQHILPDPVDPNRVSIIWRGAKQSGEPVAGGSIDGMVRLAVSTNAASGATSTWNQQVLVDGFSGGGGNKHHVYGALGSTATGDNHDVFVTWTIGSNINVYVAKYESTSGLASAATIAATAAGTVNDAMMVVDSANNPIIVYDSAVMGEDILIKKGVDGFPPTFPNPAVTVNSCFVPGNQTFMRAALDPATNRMFVLVQDESSTTHQMRLVTLDSALNLIETLDADSNDLPGNLYNHRNPHIAYKAPRLVLLWQDSEYTTTPATEQSWHFAMRLLSR
ncbi:MAG: hypothetical protein ABI743_05595, partial [bacterium]